MSSSTTFSSVQKMIYRQSRYNWRRRLIRDFILRGLGFHVLVKAQIEGTEHVPDSGPTLIMMNHLGAIDPFVVCGAITNRFVVPMTKIENYEHPIIGLMARAWGAYPVRRGEVDRQALANTVELLRQEYPVLIAPEGTRQSALSEPKHGVTYIALKANAVIVPVGLDGTEQFPHTIKLLHRTPVQVRIGAPFRFRTDGKTRIPRDQMHQMTQEAMYQLASLLPEYRRGVYHDVSRKTTEFLEFLP
jgi:1-acyl-sn-glycerol-3-phosphate acyltransferase